jgi:hypothetical protein
MHQHPSFSPAAGANEPIDPYAVIPCPHAPGVPPVLGGACAEVRARVQGRNKDEDEDIVKGDDNANADAIATGKGKGKGKGSGKGRGKGGCARERWCERHWCWGCKRENGVGRAGLRLAGTDKARQGAEVEHDAAGLELEDAGEAEGDGEVGGKTPGGGHGKEGESVVSDLDTIVLA